MNLHQFRFVQEAVKRNLNLTEVAKSLHTSQPGVSKAILELEEELGIEIFGRHGKRLKCVTEPGEHVLKSIDIILREVNNLKRIGEQYSAQDSGTLSIATTHTQARYVLPLPVAQLRSAYPNVNISLHQGAPDQVARMVLDETAEIGIATESLSDYPELITLPCYEWEHVLVLPKDHPLASVADLQLSDLAREPIITYHPSFTGRTRIDKAFAAQHLTPRIALSDDEFCRASADIDDQSAFRGQGQQMRYTLVNQPGFFPAGHHFDRKAKNLMRFFKKYVAVTCFSEGLSRHCADL